MTYSQHKDKVQSVRWNPNQEATMLTAGFDKNVYVFDPRQIDQAVYVIFQLIFIHSSRLLAFFRVM